MSQIQTQNKEIAVNRRAFHDYFIEERFEAGLVLHGWEVKSLRAQKVNLVESYVILKGGAPYVIGLHITPLTSASTHIHPDPTRSRKLLLNQKEINKLIGSVERKGFTLIPLSLYWKHGRAKIEIALAKGKKQHDKRASEKAKTWQREKARVMRSSRSL